MRIKCDYCGQMIDEELKKCPFCGGPVSTANRVASDQPKTIEELKKWYTDHHLPPEEKTRFFIGRNIKEPKAFGIYRADSGDFVVYKNKSNGERAVRYRGKDEGYAVNELYQRLRAEIADQKKNSADKGSRSGRSSGRNSSGPDITDILAIVVGILSNPVFLFIIVLLSFIVPMVLDHRPAKGYYHYDGNEYYYQGTSWYSYDPYDDTWSYADNSDLLDSVIYDDTDDTYQSYGNEGTPFEDTNWYDSGSSDDDYDWDSDSSWDSWDSSDSWDSWDSGSSDWDSDW